MTPWMRVGLLGAAAGLAACSPVAPSGTIAWQVEPQASGVTSSLRGLSVVSDAIVWVGAPDGQVLSTSDGGASWQVHDVALADGADLRSAHGFSDTHALFITAGQPARIIETRDGGASFKLVWEDPSGAAFFDSVAFWDAQLGLAFSDPVDGAFLVLRTQDGGHSWAPLEALPAPLEGEAGFAASNTSIALDGAGCAYIGTGGASRARLLRSCDRGDSWVALDTPLASGSGGAGIFAVAVSDDGRVVIVGGDYQQPDAQAGNFAWSDDSGDSWSTSAALPGGYRSGVAAVGDAWLAVGTNGVDQAGPDMQWLARDWDIPAPNAIAFAPSGERGWIVGANGGIWRLTPTD